MSKKDFRIVLLGNSNAGKSSIAIRLTKRSFNPHGSTTIGAAFLTHSVLINDKHFEFQIWDTAGQEQYHSLAPTYYRHAQGVVVVFDITDRSSFMGAQKWVSEVGRVNKKYSMTLVGNKVDLIQHRQVSTNEAWEYANQMGIPYIETSAKTAENVEKVFFDLIQKAEEGALEHNLNRSTSLIRISQQNLTKPKKNTCNC